MMTAPIKKAAGDDDTATEAFALTTVKAESRIDSRLLAKILRNQHQAAMALIERYADRFKAYGQLQFQKEVGGQARPVALLAQSSTCWKSAWPTCPSSSGRSAKC